MSGNRCVYHGCNKSQKNFQHLTMHRFPVKRDPVRAKKWLFNSGNTSLLDLTEKQLWNRYLCSDHFDEDQFFPSHKGKSLKANAIPRLYEPPIKKPLIVYKAKHNPLNRRKSFEVPDDSEDAEPEPDAVDFTNMPVHTTYKTTYTQTHKDLEDVSRLKDIILRQKKLISAKRAQISKMKKKCRKIVMCSKDLFYNINFKSANSKLLVNMQCKKKQREWTSTEKFFAANIYYKSPTAYQYILEQGIVLPCASTMKRFIRLNKDTIVSSMTKTTYKETEL